MLIGVDGGGSKNDLILFTADGKILNRVIGKGSNVSEMGPEFVRSLFLTPMPDVQTALDAAFEKLGHEASVLAMPYGGSTLPRIQ